MSKHRFAGTITACLAALLLAILDQTIVASAAAPIARGLSSAGATHQLPWLVAAYTLSSTCVGPLYGKLADRLGARPVFLTTLALFLAGSGLCATAGSVGELIGFRAVQGLGGGGLMTVTLVVLGQLRGDAGQTGHPAPSGNLLGAALVGIGLVLGPTLGGQIVEHMSWRWVFLVNLPLGGGALLVAARCLPRRAPLGHDGVDGLGAGLLAAAAAALLLAGQWGGTRYGWASLPILGLAIAGVAALTGFVIRQLRASEPLVPLVLMVDPAVRVIALLQLLAGIGMSGGALYVTFELQLVHGISPAGTGVRLLPMAAGLTCGALLGRRRLAAQASLTLPIALGSAASAAAFAALALTAAGTPYGVLAGLLWLLGAGIGVGLGTEVVILQRVVDPAHLGIATAAVRFAEELGTSLAAAGMGVLFSSRLGAPGPLAAEASTGASAAHLTGGAVAAATRPVFIVAAAAMALAAAFASRLPVRAAEAQRALGSAASTPAGAIGRAQ